MFIDMVYPVEAEMPIAINIYSAANDIITITRGSTNIKIKTDATGKGQAWLPLGTYTFTSSIGKDPDNLTDNFSKDNVEISSETTDVYLMPDGNILYWYGYISDNCEVLNSANGWAAPSGWGFGTVTYNTNYASLVSGSYQVTGMGTKNKISNLTKVHSIMLQTVAPYISVGASGLIGLNPYKDFTNQVCYETIDEVNVLKHVVSQAPTEGDYYCEVDVGRDEQATIYALWCE